MADVVGSAYVRIRAITTQLASDIQDGIKKSSAGIGPDVDKLGDDMGKRLGSKISESTSSGLKDAVSSSSPEFKKFGAVSGEQMSLGFAESMKQDFSKVVQKNVTDVDSKSRPWWHLWGKHANEQLSLGLGDDNSRLKTAAESLGSKFVGFFSASTEKEAKKKPPLSGFEKALNKAAKSIKLPTLPFLGIIAAPAIAGAVKAVSAYIGDLIGIIGNLSVAAVGASAAVGALLGGLALSAGVLLLAFKAASPALFAFQVNLKAVGDEWKKTVGLTTQATLLPGLTDALNTSKALIPVFTEFGRSVGEIAGQTAKWAVSSLTTNKALGEWMVILDQSRQSLFNMGRVIGQLAPALLTLFSTAAPLATQLSNSLADMATHFNEFIQRTAASGELTKFLQDAYDKAVLLGRGISDLFAGIWNVLKIGAETSKPAIDTFDSFAQRFRDWTKSIEGSNAIRNFFESARPVAAEINAIIRDILIAIGKPITAGNTGGLVDTLEQIRTQILPAIFNLVSQITSGVSTGSLKDLINTLTNLLGLLSSTGAIETALKAFTLGMQALIIVLGAPGVGQAVTGGLAILSMLSGFALVIPGLKLEAELKGIGHAFEGLFLGFTGTGVDSALKKGPKITNLFEKLGRNLAGLPAKLAESATIGPILESISAAFEGITFAGFAAGLGTAAAAIAIAVTIIIGAFEQFLAIVFVLKNGFDLVQAPINAFFDFIKTNVPFVAAPIQFLQDRFNDLANFFKNLDFGKIIGGIKDFFVNLPGWIGNVPEAIGKFFGNIPGWLANIPGALATAGQAILTFFTNIPGWLANIPAALADFFSNLPGWIAGFVANIGSTLWGWITSSLPELLGQIASMNLVIAGWLLGLAGKILGWVANAAGALWGWIADAVPAALIQLGKWALAIGTFLLGIPAKIAGFLANAGLALIEWVGTAIVELPKKLAFLLGFIIGWAIKLPAIVLVLLFKAGQALVGWISDAIPNIINALISIVGTIGVFLGGLPETIARAVAGAAVALWDWIVQAVPAALNAIGGFFSAVIDFIASLPDRIVFTLENAPSALWEWIKTAIPAALEALGGFFIAVGGFLENLPGIIAGAVVSAAKGLWGWIQDAVPAALEALGGFFESIGSFLAGLPAKIGGWLVDVGIAFANGLESAAPGVGTALLHIGETVGKFLLGLPGKIIGWVVGAAEAIWHWLPEPSVILTKIGEFEITVGTGILNFVAKIPGWLIGGITAITGWLIDAVPVVITNIAAFADNVFNAIIGFLAQIPGWFIQGLVAITGWLLDAIPTVIANFAEFANNVFNAIVGFVASIPGWLVDAVTGMIQWAIDAAGQIGGKLIEFGGKVFDWVGGFIRDLPGMFGDVVGTVLRVGSDIIDGIVKGLVDNVSKVWDWIKGLAGDVVHNVMSFFGINSPAKIMVPLGASVVEGLVLGMDNMAPDMEDAVGRMVDPILGLNSKTFDVSPGINLTPKVASAGSVAGGTTTALSSLAASINGQPVSIRVFIGDKELTDIVDVQIDGRDQTLARKLTQRGV